MAMTESQTECIKKLEEKLQRIDKTVFYLEREVERIKDRDKETGRLWLWLGLSIFTALIALITTGMQVWG